LAHSAHAIDINVPCNLFFAQLSNTSIIGRMLEEPALPEVLVPFVRSFAGGAGGTVQTMVGDASTRRYHRVRLDGGSPSSVVVMELPDNPLRSDELTAGEVPPELPFVNVHRYLAAGGLPVPAIYRTDMALGLIALEDLGDQTLEIIAKSSDRAQRRALYYGAIDHIVALQQLAEKRPDQSCVAFSRRFDQPLLRWELDHFREWYLEAELGVSLTAEEGTTVETAFTWLARTLADSPVTLVHRDFQSRNLMVVQNDGLTELRVIDFQDALLGSKAYDLVALLRDSYIELPPEEVADHVAYFRAAAGLPEGEFERLFVLQTLQRKLKDTGRFIFIDRVRKNPSFLRWIPTSLRYVGAALREAPPELAGLRQVLEKHVPGLFLPPAETLRD
jgi:aminoglycoside/choline kinase family phosphotransferase